MLNKFSDPRIIVALDFSSVEPARALVSQLHPKLCRLKIGSILFTRYGPSLIEEWQNLGFSIFLDLKFYDIPQTVAGACKVAAELGVWMVNIHLLAGQEVVAAAYESLAKVPGSKRPLLIGVTVLTSLNATDLSAVGINKDIPTLVLSLAKMAQDSGFDGVVCSPLEISLLRHSENKIDKNFLLVTPGIRLAETESKDDQKRIATPHAAIHAGADYLVIGRPITQAKEPQKILYSIINDLGK